MDKGRLVCISKETLNKLTIKIDIEKFKTYFNMTWTEEALIERLDFLGYKENEIAELLKHASYYYELGIDADRIARDKKSVKELLDEKPHFINAHFLPDGETLLHKAFNYSVAKLLINLGADVNARDFRGNTPLHVTYNPAIAELLLSKGASPEAVNKLGFTPAGYQEARGNYDIANPSYDTGGEVYGKMALMVAEAIRYGEKESDSKE